MKKFPILLIIGFIVLYSFFIFFVDIKTAQGTEIIASGAFFFALFSGFFIARQNERHTRIASILADRDGTFSHLYRISGFIPKIQKEVREIIRNHYEKILESNNWAYHEFNPSMTITRLVEAFGSITNEEAASPKVSVFYRTIWNAIFQLQQLRKRIIAAYNERLGLFPWIIIYTLAGILLFSFDFIPSDSFIIDIMKIMFGTAIFLIIILIKQLDNMALFGKDFSQKIAQDVLRILNEVDSKELEIK